MKKSLLYIYVVIQLIFMSCEKPSDCIESSGKTISKNIEVNPFSKIKVYKGIELIIKVGTEYKVEIVTGENLLNNIEFKQIDNQIIFKDNSTCNWVRKFGETKIYITTPTLEEIYSKTDRTISSDGILTFENLSIISFDKDADGEAGAGTGDFYLSIQSSNFQIHNNNVSRFFINGFSENASFNFYFGDGRIEAENFEVQHMQIFHRGSNDMIVKPIQKISGVLNSTGNVILKNIPPLVELQELYHGRVIYN